MSEFWEDDKFLDAAKKLTSENEAELRARLVAQALRLNDETTEHLRKMRQASELPVQVLRVANVLARNPQFVEPVTVFLEGLITKALPEEADGTEP